MFELQNTVLNDVLCFISTARKTLPHANVTAQTVGFYDDGAIRKAKETIFKICNEKPVARKSCSSHPNPSVADVEDILNLFHRMGSKSFLFPDFVAGSYASLPPSSGFDAMASVMGSLRDELFAVREEFRQMREKTVKDAKAMEDIVRVKDDIEDIKLLISGLHCQQENSSENSNAAVIKK